VRGRRRQAVAPLVALILAAGCGTGAEPGGGNASGIPTATEATPDASALQMRPVESITAPDTDAYDRDEPTCGAGAGSPCTEAQLQDPDGITLEDEAENRYALGALLVDGSNVTSATTVDLGDGTWGVQVALDPEGTTAFAAATAEAVTLTPPANQIAIVVEGVVVSAPIVQAPIDSGQAQISGGFTQQEADDLAVALGGS
jgi:preprotein translocase subunit SecD